MNKAITDGLELMPPAFATGLAVWSREDGTPGSATYADAPDAAFVPADQDFGGAIEIVKTEGIQRLRWTGETPILPGCYLRIRARVKALSGNMPSVRIAGWAGGAGGAAVTGVPLAGPSVALAAYGQVVEVSAIVGTGARTGVDLQWTPEVLYGHFGLDLTGPNGGAVRIDDIVIEDVTAVFHRKMMDWVDVKDYGAAGDGVTDDSAAFEAADAAANGRQVLVSEGIFLLADHVTFENAVRFEGRVTMPEDKRLILRQNFRLPTYIDAFGDEVLAFRKAFQALLNFSDHESLDLGGRRIELVAPIDMQAAVATEDIYEIRRVIRNGQFNCLPGAGWDTEVHASQASYSTADPLRLTAVANVANIPVGALVEGPGVGREVYVRSKDIAAGTIDLSQQLFGPAASQVYTFRRFKYALDFSGFSKLSKLTLTDIDFQCQGAASGILLAPDGNTFHVRDCHITKPRYRGITSIGIGCQDLQIDRCHFTSDEQQTPATERESIGFNVNANDAKIRDNRFQRLGTTMVLHGNGHLIVGNHWFQGDNVTDGPRVAGLVFTETNVKSVVTGNYIDNSFIEWTNEHDATPAMGAEFSFGGLTVTGNIFTVNDAAPWFSWFVVKPYGAGHFIQGLSVTGNTFKSLNGTTTRIERVDSSIAGLDFSRTRNVEFSGNTFNGIGQNTINPVTLEFNQSGAATNWVLDVSGYLPFGGWSREVTALVIEGPLRNGSGQTVFATPYVTTLDGAGNNLVRLTWPQALSGRVHVTARVDRPI
ncbi:glycosyl hydrolase family 28-related protein [Palleronia sp. KMU-117]|uniref:glycosyl hydrolase family 28-related protein n=1 Tax=Palleronia sp. KMU-117 TaxID=3434108 RepID=UPI003D74488A